MTTLATWACTVAELPQKLPAAIERMQAIEEKRGPCIVIVEKLTDRFAQLYGGFRRPIMVDVPVAPGAPNASCLKSIQAELYGEPEQIWDDGIQIYQAKFSPGAGALAALKTMITMHRALVLPLDAEVVVEEILAGMKKYSENATS